MSEDKIKSFAAILTGSDLAKNAKDEESQTAEMLNEIMQSLEIMRCALDAYVNDLNTTIPEEIGEFRTISSDWESTFPLTNIGLTINCSDVHEKNKSVCIRFDPSDSLEKQKKISYLYLKFYMGLTTENKLYWLVTSRDQGHVKEYIVEQFGCDSVLAITNEKCQSLDELISPHFLERVQSHFPTPVNTTIKDKETPLPDSVFKRIIDLFKR